MAERGSLSPKGIPLTELDFSELEDFLPKPEFELAQGARLRFARQPEVFVAPKLEVVNEHGEGLSAEVLVVEASAAVGKSTMARQLSWSCHLPLLDLSDVPVSTQSLIGLLQSDVGNARAISAFHAGELPVIVDALDEGRLLSGEQSFEGFLETTGELLARDRAVSDRPKLILFGRGDSASLARLGLNLGSEDLSVATVRVGFFDHDAATQLIDAYARSSADDDAQYHRHKEPAQQLVEAYFEAIEGALELDGGTLWERERGRAFAGYAPVLAALGSILAEIDNFIDVANRLRESGAREAWEVIETVLGEILERERDKFVHQLAQHVTSQVPAEAYDAQEQLTLITQYVHGQQVTGTGRVQLRGPDQTMYFDKIEQYLSEHPFIREKEFTNGVLGALVLAHAVEHDLLNNADLARLEEHSRAPFLWRSFRSRLDAQNDALIDGQYLGVLLNSYWNDPMNGDVETVSIRSQNEEGVARVLVPEGRGFVALKCAFPLTLYGQTRDCDLDLDGQVTLNGRAPSRKGSGFLITDGTSIRADRVVVEAENVTLRGEVRLECSELVSPSALNLVVRDDAQLGLFGAFSEQYPWSRQPSSLEQDVPTEGGTLERLVDECWKRLPDGLTLTLNPDFTVTDDERMAWVDRNFSVAFQALVRAMVERGLASSDRMSASGSRKVRVRLDVQWSQLRNAVRNPDEHPELAPLVADVQQRIQ